jgi:hypothetical protein
LVVSGEVRVEEVDSMEGLEEESWGEEEEEVRAGSRRRNMAEVMERRREGQRRGEERERERKEEGREGRETRDKVGWGWED